MRDYIVVGYYTKNTIYANEASKLIESLLKYSVPNDIIGIDDQGSWFANTNFKPTFLLKMSAKYPDKPIIYVDCDATFRAYPELFDTLNCDFAVYVFDRAANYPGGSGFEILSGTIYLRHGEQRDELLLAWNIECANNPTVWDQKSLAKVIGNDFTKLPGEYCKIFDRMKDIEYPVIVHHQISRKVRNKHSPLSRLI